jgi:signal transduction histidine kinase
VFTVSRSKSVHRYSAGAFSLNLQIMDYSVPISRPAERGVFGAITDRTLAQLRVLLAISAILIIYIDPGEPDRLHSLNRLALGSYFLYACVVLIVAQRAVNFSLSGSRLLAWSDVVWYGLLISLSTGTNAVFFFFFFFAIIAGSSRGGTRLGLSLTLGSTLLFLTLNLLLAPSLELDTARFMRRAIYLGLLGSTLAFWGGAESDLKRKLMFLKDVASMSNPRFGVEHTIRQMLHRFLDFYRADYAFLLLRVSEFEYDLHRASRPESDVEHKVLRVREAADIPLMQYSSLETAAFVEKASRWRSSPEYLVYNPQRQGHSRAPANEAQALAEFLNVRSFITSPLRYRDRTTGRILVGRRMPAGFDAEDAAFLQQAAEQMVPIIENIRLVDRLVLDVAEDERKRLARSIHDRVIQPYLGLQIGLKALQQELVQSGKPRDSFKPRSVSLLERLIAMTREGIEELRQYVHGLKEPHPEQTLADSIRRFSEQFENATGIHVKVSGDPCLLTMADRLSVEIFQMTAEALSNVHRHTHSRNATVRLVQSPSNLELTIENETDEGMSIKPFNPLSISERAESIGAKTEILWPPGKTLLRVEVPL